MSEAPLIILASARKQSETGSFVQRVFAEIEHDVLDLLDFQVAPYQYSGLYPDGDDFSKITEALLQHKVIVFATPVYWYAMSGLLKTVFDRFTDLVTIRKTVGRQLKGKATFLLAIGADPELPDGFEVPFRLTADYLDMAYGGCIYQSTKFPKTTSELQHAINSFTAALKKHST